jgi:hypothetical protein
MRTETYFVTSGRLSIYKTPSAELYYGINLKNWLAKAGTSLASVTATVAGVTLAEDAAVDGTIVKALVAGLDEADGAENWIRFDFTCTDDKSRDSRTIHFLKRPA